MSYAYSDRVKTQWACNKRRSELKFATEKSQPISGRVCEDILPPLLPEVATLECRLESSE
ncbi:hypothetical protein PoB_000175500, partial [Plakobranchus ocellatus]